MGRIAEWTDVQKTVIDILHKKSKPQEVIVEEASHSQTSVSMHINRRLSGRTKRARKRFASNRENHSVGRIVKQNLRRKSPEFYFQTKVNSAFHFQIQDPGSVF